MEFTKIKETCLYIRDLEQAKNFYNGVLGLSVINYQRGKHLFLRVGESVLLLFNPEDSKGKASPPAHFGGGKQHFAFEVCWIRMRIQSVRLRRKESPSSMR